MEAKKGRKASFGLALRLCSGPFWDFSDSLKAKFAEFIFRDVREYKGERRKVRRSKEQPGAKRKPGERGGSPDFRS
jgi:hypothetical protein